MKSAVIIIAIANTHSLTKGSTNKQTCKLVRNELIERSSVKSNILLFFLSYGYSHTLDKLLKKKTET